MFSRLNKASAEYVMFGDRKVEIPKLTVGKWEKLFEQIEALPQLLVSVFTARGTSDFTATAIVAASIAMDEIVGLVACITELDREYIKDNVGLTELMDFIARTVKKNDLVEAAKKFQAVFAKLNVAVDPPASSGL